ncbi:MAG: iron chelate uptake ABC transporter family permease subunit, partial [Actinobacteria bacterium]|nr:iron chelate uptake ABC transporter family permease subunit [Actinomycetota bacterium]
AILRNPMADPYIIGTAAGASLGATIGIVVPLLVPALAIGAGSAWLGLGIVQLLAFTGGIGTVLLVIAVARSGGRLPSVTLLLTGYAVSSLLAAGAALSGHGLWFVGLSALLPWTPLLVYEIVWKRERYGLFATFLAVAFIQTLHMGEHSVQVLQMLGTHGDLAHSHGVFGQLDFETVHFVADTLLWLALGVFLVLFRGANRWLWVAFAAASLHQIEHFYLFWMYLVDRGTYVAGGFAGIMGSGGVIGSPLGRPYLHFSYNMIVIVPMLVALWDQARSMDATPHPRR